MKRNVTWLAMSLEDSPDRSKISDPTPLLSADHRFDDAQLSQLFGAVRSPEERWSNRLGVNNPKLIWSHSSNSGTGIYALLIRLACRCDSWVEVWRHVVTKRTQRHETTRMSLTRHHHIKYLMHMGQDIYQQVELKWGQYCWADMNQFSLSILCLADWSIIFEPSRIGI